MKRTLSLSQIALGVFSALLLGASPSLGGYSSMRCGTDLVGIGDSQYEVKSVCGEPDGKARRVERRTVRRAARGECRQMDEAEQREAPRELDCRHVEEHSVEVVVDEWIYDFGKQRFVEHAFFEDGYLTSIKTGSYGHKD